MQELKNFTQKEKHKIIHFNFLKSTTEETWKTSHSTDSLDLW